MAISIFITYLLRYFMVSTQYTGYFMIGSLVMLLHDISDVPLDLLRIFMLLKWDVCTVSASNEPLVRTAMLIQ